jgi:hypothetical protein
MLQFPGVQGHFGVNDPHEAVERKLFHVFRLAPDSFHYANVGTIQVFWQVAKCSFDQPVLSRNTLLAEIL